MSRDEQRSKERSDMYVQYGRVSAGEMKNHPREHLLGWVMNVLDDYRFGCGRQ